MGENGKVRPQLTGVLQTKDGDKYITIGQTATWFNEATGNQPVQKTVITGGKMVDGKFVPDGTKLYMSQWKAKF